MSQNDDNLTNVTRTLLRDGLQLLMLARGHFSSTSQELASTLQTESRVIPK